MILFPKTNRQTLGSFPNLFDFSNHCILQEARDPETGILLLDFILGYNSSMNPVGELFEAIQQAQKIAGERGDCLEVVASICGTEEDAQDIQMQKKLLTECGAVVFTSNARATEYCVQLLARQA